MVLYENHVLARKIGSFRVVLYENCIYETLNPAGHFGEDGASGTIHWILWLIHWMFLKTFTLYVRRNVFSTAKNTNLQTFYQAQYLAKA